MVFVCLCKIVIFFWLLKRSKIIHSLIITDLITIVSHLYVIKMSSRENHVVPTKKARTNSNSAMTSAQTQNTTNNDTNNEFVPIFSSEISDIMRGFGDCATPLRATVILVEKIVHQQLYAIVQEVIELAIARKGVPEPHQCDFEHMMRKHPNKIFRMHKHLKDIRIRQRLQDLMSGRPTAPSDDQDGNDKSDSEGRDVPEKFDEQKTRRWFRADQIALSLTGTQYRDYNEARRTSFCSRNSVKMRTKLRSWLKIPADVVLNSNVLAILAHLIHETIATLVDFAILTRLNTANRINNHPFSNQTGNK